MHHFGAIGVINGLAVLGDRETFTRWDHITGQAFDGPLAETQLDAWPIHLTTVAAAMETYPSLKFHTSSHRSFKSWLAQNLYPRYLQDKIWLPPPFHLSMSAPIDPRLPGLTQGLGIIVGKRARYYPIAAIPAGGLRDDWNGRPLRVSLGKIDHVPHAIWQDTGDQPMQLLSRWYGFSFTYPNCEIYGN